MQIQIQGFCFDSGVGSSTCLWYAGDAVVDINPADFTAYATLSAAYQAALITPPPTGQPTLIFGDRAAALLGTGLAEYVMLQQDIVGSTWAYYIGTVGNVIAAYQTGFADAALAYSAAAGSPFRPSDFDFCNVGNAPLP